MLPRQKWTDHKFNLGIDIGWTQNVMCRVKDTAIRLEHHCQNLNDEQLSLRINNAWSIKEHIGHLIDLEELHLNRLKQFPNLPEILEAADMSNAKTYTANHNQKDLDSLMKKFISERNIFIREYEQLNARTQNHQAMHPRIKMLMRPIDLLFFIAEHDDHHIASILQIKNDL